MALDLPGQNLSLPSEPWKNLEEILKRLSSSREEQVSLTELSAALEDTLVVPRSSRLQHPALTSYGCKLQHLRSQVRRIARERDQARLDLEKVERRCLQLGRELDEQKVALKHTQLKLKDFQAEIEAKELLLQEAVSHQAKMEADTQLLQGKEARLQRTLNHTMKEKTQLQNKVMDMAEKLVASEKLVLELQKELNHIVKDKLGQMEPHSLDLLNQNECFAGIVLEYQQQCQVLWDQNEVLQREVERLHHQLQESRAERGLPAGGLSSEGSSLPVCHSPSHLIPTSACTKTSLLMEQLQEQLWDLKVQLKTKLFEDKTSLNQAEIQHALQLQQAKAQMNNMVPKKQFEQLQTSLREEQCKAHQLQEKLHQQAEQTCRQLVRTQKEHEHLLQAAVEQAKGLEHSLRSADAVLAEREAQLKDAQAQLSRNKLLIEDLREENRQFAVALQAADLKQKSTEEKNQLLKEQASALKQLLGKITPASLSG